jgi:quercetin dioxygenase-like cupin family protein
MRRALSIKDAAGFQHAGDQYYYRPLVAGEELFMYVAHIPANGSMPPDAEEAKLFELSLFMLDGELTLILDTDEFVAGPGDAVHVPRGVAFGVKNPSDKSASFVLAFAPPPGKGTIEERLENARARGRHVLEPKDFDPIIGKTVFPFR